MSRRILIALPIALVVGLAFSVSSALAIRVGDPLYAPVQTSSAPIVSEKTAGLVQASHSNVPVGFTKAEYRALMLRSQALDRMYGLGQSSRPAVSSEVSTGVVQPFSHTAQPVAATDDGFNWGDAGIGAAAVFGTMLLGAASVLTLRRYRGTLAH
jgi:hypothetical protein